MLINPLDITDDHTLTIIQAQKNLQLKDDQLRDEEVDYDSDSPEIGT